MSYNYMIYNVDAKELAEQLAEEIVGHKIVEVDSLYNEITLDNDTTLRFVPTSDCCAWFDAAIKNHKIVDHVITDVQYNDVDGDDEAPRQFHLHILAEGISITDVHVYGDEGSGYYVHSVNVTVEQP